MIKYIILIVLLLRLIFGGSVRMIDNAQVTTNTSELSLLEYELQQKYYGYNVKLSDDKENYDGDNIYEFYVDNYTVLVRKETRLLNAADVYFGSDVVFVSDFLGTLYSLDNNGSGLRDYLESNGIVFNFEENINDSYGEIVLFIENNISKEDVFNLISSYFEVNVSNSEFVEETLQIFCLNSKYYD